MTITIHEQPPIGFIVEGHGEHDCYPSLVSRVLGTHHYSPIVNAGGCGSVVRNLKKHLTDLCTTRRPFHVMVTVDLVDLLRHGEFADCKDVVEHLKREAAEWMEESKRNPRIQPRPQRISIVIQIPKFEGWLLSDIASLKQCGHLRDDAPDIQNADEYAGDPCKYLYAHLESDLDVKCPAEARSLFSSVNPEQMCLRSRSFDKFCRELKALYSDWYGRLQ